MKKNIIFAAFAAASALLLVSSCAKEQVNENINTGDGKTFTASIEEGLKTTITGEYKVNWEQGDLIDISGGTTYSATPDASDATRAIFTKVSGPDPTPDYIAVYPASIFKNGRHELPATQTYAASKFNAPMCAISETESLEFKNFCGVLCFALKGTDKVKSIAVTAKEQICGPFEFSTDATFGCFSGENVGYTVTLNCGEGVQLAASTATNFYISLPPATYTAGMKIVITNTEGKTIEKTTTKSAAIARNKIYTFNWTATFAPAPLPVGALSGEFSISDTKKVHFSQGNLTYDVNASTNKWKFYEHQYDCATSYDPNLISLFTWGYGTWSTSPDGTGYQTGDFTDWGSQIGDGNTWRTLTTAEWQYLFNYGDYTSDVRNGKYKWATVNGVNGYVIAPDDFSGELANTYADDAALAANNLVFLPAASNRFGSYVDDVGFRGYYWSSTADESNAYYVYFDSDDVGPGSYGSRNNGFSARLVTEEGSPAPSVVPVESVSLDKTAATLNVNGTVTLSATVLPDNATDKSVSWSSNNTGVATVDASGKVTAVAAGTATITVTTTDGGKTATCSVTVVATVNFPDEVFRNYMIQNFDLDNDGTISLDEASKVEMIYIETTDIESLSGIEYCPELKVLGCCGFSKERGKLKEVDVSKNPKLISLMLDDNSLESLDISRNVNIQGVSCRNNNISSINISDNADLSFLDISGNSISTLNLSSFKNLNSLYATGNELKTLDLSENQVLEWIEVSDNKLENLVLPSSVVILYCMNNHLKTVDFSNTPKLYKLVINHTDNIDLSSCTELNNLHCTDVKNLNISNTNLEYEYGFSEISGANSITAKNCKNLEFTVNTSSCVIDTDVPTVKVFVYDQIETSIKFGDSKVDNINLETYRNEGDGEKCYGLTRVESKNVSFIDVLDPTYPNVLSFCYGSEDRYDAVPNLKRINFYSAPTEIRLSKKDLSGMINIYSELKKTVYIAKSKLTDFGPYVPITTGYTWKYVESVPIIVNTYTKSIISPEILTTGARETNWTPQKDGYEWHPIKGVDFDFNDKL